MSNNNLGKAEFRSLILDETRSWTRIKHGIVKKYAEAYSIILAGQKMPRFSHAYIDAFAGAGLYDKGNKKYIPGSALTVLDIRPAFDDYYFIDIDSAKIQILQSLVEGRSEKIHLLEGDCNEILPTQVFPIFEYRKFRRALCFIDPYGLDFDWKVIEYAGNMKTIDLILNFSIMDANRNIFLKDPTKIKESEKERAARSLGKDWRDVGYSKNGHLFGWEEKINYQNIAERFRFRLEKVAGFKSVPQPILICNSKGAPLYYIFFASQKPVAAKIANDIFNRYRTSGTG